MKNIKCSVFYFVLILIGTYFSSCSDSEQDLYSNERAITIEERYQLSKDFAELHSKGLDFVYQDLYKHNTNSNLLRASESDYAELMGVSLAEFLSQEQAIATISDFNQKMNFREKSMALRSSDDNQDILEVLSFFDQAVDNIDNFLSPEFEIYQIIGSPEFAALSEVEQNQLLVLFAIFDDSANYWEESIEGWNDLFNDENNVATRSVGTIPNSVQVSANRTIAKADAIGGLSGAIGGGISGAIGGAFAGPKGALAGGIGGFIGGGVGGAISASLTMYLMQSSSSTSSQLFISMPNGSLEAVPNGQIIQLPDGGLVKYSNGMFLPLSATEILQLMSMY